MREPLTEQVPAHAIQVDESELGNCGYNDKNDFLVDSGLVVLS
jgi:hypothetical protein